MKSITSYSREFEEEIKEYNSATTMAKASSVSTATIFSVIGICVGDSKLLQEMKDTTSKSKWLHMIERFSRKCGEGLKERGLDIIGGVGVCTVTDVKDNAKGFIWACLAGNTGVVISDLLGAIKAQEKMIYFPMQNIVVASGGSIRQKRKKEKKSHVHFNRKVTVFGKKLWSSVNTLCKFERNSMTRGDGDGMGWQYGMVGG
ncbi:hypothetical protein Tco_0642973 [Tanacetum coccineum]